MRQNIILNIKISISILCILYILGLFLYFAIDSMMKVNIIRNIEKTVSTMSVEKAKIINYYYKNGTSLELQINNGKIIKTHLALEYKDINLNDELIVIYYKKIFNDYIIVQGLRAYEYEMKEYFIFFFILLIPMSYLLYKLIKLVKENYCT